MTKHEKKIYKIIKKLKKECKKYDLHCTGCPLLLENGECMIYKTTPRFYSLNYYKTVHGDDKEVITQEYDKSYDDYLAHVNSKNGLTTKNEE